MPSKSEVLDLGPVLEDMRSRPILLTLAQSDCVSVTRREQALGSNPLSAWVEGGWLRPESVFACNRDCVLTLASRR